MPLAEELSEQLLAIEKHFWIAARKPIASTPKNDV